MRKYCTILSLLLLLSPRQHHKVLQEEWAVREVVIKEEKSLRSQKDHFIFHGVGILGIRRWNKFYYSVNKWPFNAEKKPFGYGEGPIPCDLMWGGGEGGGRRGRAPVWLILGDSWATAGMRQRSTVPLLAVILAAVRSRGKSFSQSLASHTICLRDARMRQLLLLFPSLPHHLLLSPNIPTSNLSVCFHPGSFLGSYFRITLQVSILHPHLESQKVLKRLPNFSVVTYRDEHFWCLSSHCSLKNTALWLGIFWNIRQHPFSQQTFPKHPGSLNCEVARCRHSVERERLLNISRTSKSPLSVCLRIVSRTKGSPNILGNLKGNFKTGSLKIPRTTWLSPRCSWNKHKLRPHQVF